MKRETEPVGSYEFDAHPDFPPKRYAEYRLVDIIPERTEDAADVVQIETSDGRKWREA